MAKLSLIPCMQSVVPHRVHLAIPKSSPLDDAIAVLSGFGPERPEEENVLARSTWGRSAWSSRMSKSLPQKLVAQEQAKGHCARVCVA